MVSLSMTVPVLASAIARLLSVSFSWICLFLLGGNSWITRVLLSLVSYPARPLLALIWSLVRPSAFSFVHDWFDSLLRP
jgi:hypothetical protein